MKRQPCNQTMHSCKNASLFLYEYIDPPHLPQGLHYYPLDLFCRNGLGLGRLVFRTLHSLFTVMLLWFSNGLRANESPVAETVQLAVCLSQHFVFFILQACLWLFVLMFLSSRVVAVFINLKPRRGGFTTAFLKQIYHRDIGYSVSFQGY